MAFGEVVFVVEDGDFLACRVVGDVSYSVNVCSLHDDAVLYLRVLYGVVVSADGAAEVCPRYPCLSFRAYSVFIVFSSRLLFFRAPFDFR